jgi:hypothetical protein
VTFTTTVTNHSAPLSDVTITNTVPDPFTVQAATGSSGAAVTTNGQTVTAQIASLPAGGTVTVTVTTVVQAGQYGDFTNTATVTGAGIHQTATAQVAIPSLPNTGYGYGAQVHRRSLPLAWAVLAVIVIAIAGVAIRRRRVR